MNKVRIVMKGGPGSGHHGHKGRPGKRGGSLPSGTSAADLRAQGYIAIYRGTGAAGVQQIRPSEDGVLGPGVYWYDNPIDARAYAEPGGGIITAFVHPSQAQIFPGQETTFLGLSTKDPDVIVTGTDVLRRGVVPTEHTLSVSDLRDYAAQALEEEWGISIKKEHEVDAMIAWMVPPELRIVMKGGSGSGNFGHAGRPGKVGGSAPRYFTRFIQNPAQAQIDAERGFSFDGYLLLDNPEDVMDFLGLEYDPENIEEAIQEHGLAQDTGEMAGMWGKALPGLCGFEACSLEEAREFVSSKRTVSAGGWTHAAIFTGQYVGNVYDGDLFRPESVVEIIELEDTAFKQHEVDAMIAWMVPPELRAALAQPEGAFPPGSNVVPPEEYHITLHYLGDVGEFDIDEVVKALVSFSMLQEPVPIILKPEVERFEKVEDGTVDAVHVAIAGEPIQRFRAAMMSALAGKVREDTYPTYNPHITLAYVPTGAEAQPTLRKVQTTIDAIHLVLGKSVRTFPLTPVKGGALRIVRVKGGTGSGNFGHAGRPGKVGGSAPSKVGTPVTDAYFQQGAPGDRLVYEIFDSSHRKQIINTLIATGVTEEELEGLTKFTNAWNPNRGSWAKYPALMGVYDPETKTIHLNPNSGHLSSTLLHELGHHVDIKQTVIEHRAVMGKAWVNIRNDLDRLPRHEREGYLAQYGLREYSVTSADEFRADSYMIFKMSNMTGGQGQVARLNGAISSASTQMEDLMGQPYPDSIDQIFIGPAVMKEQRVRIIMKGGPGSGHHGHAG